MRLSFANGEHADFVLDGGVVSLGNAHGNTLVLPALDVAPWHARFTVDPRGIVLEVLDPSARTHVNARPVRERALLRYGDLVCLGRVPIAVKSDRDDLIGTSIPEDAAGQGAATQPARVVLRGVSGNHYGKSLAVNPRLVVGSAPTCDLVIAGPRVAQRHAVVENIGDAIWVRDLGSVDGTVVNGIQVRNAIVHSGDQIAFGDSHFIVEAPGLPLRGEPTRDAVAAAAVDSDVADDSDADAAVGYGAVWWLIGAAALIALGLAWLIQRGV